MGELLKEFSHLFMRRTIPTLLAESEESPQQLADRRRDEIEDARIALRTQFFKEYREALEYEVSQLSPDPLLGSDVGACVTFKREGLARARQILDDMKRLAEEKIADD